MLRILASIAVVFSAAVAAAAPMTVDWIQNDPAQDGPSCVATCARLATAPVASGTISYPVSGDPSLYVCRATLPGANAVFGARAGYNWNGAIGANAQPGCTVVGGGVGYSHIQTFECLCDIGAGQVSIGGGGGRRL